MADFSRANFVQSVGREVKIKIGSGGQNKKEMGFLFLFSIGGIIIASVDSPSRESTDYGLTTRCLELQHNLVM